MDVTNVATQVSAIATTQALTAWGLAGNFLALIILTVILLIFAMKGGRGGLISLIIALYAGYAIYALFPYTDQVLAFGGTAFVKGLISVGLYLAASFLPFLFIRRITGGGFGSLSFIPNLILSVLTAGFLIALGYHAFDVSHIYAFPDQIKAIFSPNQWFFYWFIAPLVGLIIFAH